VRNPDNIACRTRLSMRQLSEVILRWGLVGVTSLGTPAMAAGEGRPFVVADSIEMTVLADPNAALAPYLGASAQRSPDGGSFFVVTRRGDLSRGITESRLLIFTAEELRRSLSGGPAPVPHEVFRLASDSNVEAIASARWLSNRAIAFLGTDPTHGTQVYRADVSNRVVKRLTNDRARILDFDISPQSRRFLYLAEAPITLPERLPSYVVGTQDIITVESRGERNPYPLATFRVGGIDHAPLVDIPADPTYGDFRRIWVSPSGNRAIVAQHVRSPPPPWWSDYAPLRDNPRQREAYSSDREEYLAHNPNLFLQYALVDLTTGRSRALFSAPSGLLFGGVTLWAHWSADEQHVILANTFLPLPAETAEESVRRSRSPSIIEVDLSSGSLNRIVDVLPQPGDAARGLYQGAAFIGEDGLKVQWSAGVRTSYRRGADGWHESSGSNGQQPGSALDLRVDQSLDRPPELAVTDTMSGRSVTITDLNPQLRDVAWAHVAPLTWRDDTGREWTGGLIKPPGASIDRRYPLVIQTHGFDPSTFLVDGPGGSASGFAARALAARGIVVLQVRDGREALQTPKEAATQVAGYAAAVKTLNAAGLIDESHVGLHGWSRTGYYVQHALVFQGLELTAASVSDPSELGLWSYVNFFGAPYPGMLEFERMMGGLPWGETAVQQWVAQDPTLHLESMHTPLRIEVYRDGFSWWDMYAMLRRHGRPVEYLSYPDGSHVLFKPRERLASGEGTVDWYDFWLNGHEDPSPDKDEQYTRWRRMRALQ